MMKRLSRRTFIAAGLGASAAAMARWETRPDTILYNGRILTMSTREPEVEALAVAGSRVFATGKSTEMLALAASGARRFDLGGQRVTPGFNDAHSHPGDGGVSLVTRVALEMDSIEAIKAAIAAKAATTAPGEWVVGFLYDDTKTPRPLERADLDAAAPHHPVLVQHRGGHTAFVNSRALAAAKVEENTPDPPHGEYFRDAAGRHNGRVAEDAAEAIAAARHQAPVARRLPQGRGADLKTVRKPRHHLGVRGRRQSGAAAGVSGCARCRRTQGSFLYAHRLWRTRQDDRRRSAHRLRR